MAPDQDERPWRAYRRFLEGLSPAAVDRLDSLAAPDIHYHDPFVDARGLAQVKRVFRMMFEDIEAPRFTFTHSACDGDTCFLRWHFTCRPKSIERGHPWVCDGITEIRFDANGRVIEHVEHWDAGEQVYEKLPVLRAVIRLVKRRLSGWRG
ncbi:MAG: nuclear transport factor 2 family protein [Solirubrobacterales bacterium]